MGLSCEYWLMATDNWLTSHLEIWLMKHREWREQWNMTTVRPVSQGTIILFLLPPPERVCWVVFNILLSTYNASFQPCLFILYFDSNWSLSSWEMKISLKRKNHLLFFLVYGSIFLVRFTITLQLCFSAIHRCVVWAVENLARSIV